MTRLSAYYRELRYILESGANLGSRAALLTNCVLFHLNNLLGRPKITAPFAATLRIAPGYEAKVYLRTFTGDLFVLFEVMNEKCYDIPNVALPREDVRVIIDCGANIGMTSLYLAGHYPHAHIYSVEPDADNFALLSANTRAEPRITAIHAAVVGKPCPFVRMTQSVEAWRNRISADGEGDDVPAITIQQLCEQYDLSKIDLLKMDIEGAEAEVLRNGLFLDKVEFLIAELHGEYGHSDFAADTKKHGLVAARAGELPGLRLTFAHR